MRPSGVTALVFFLAAGAAIAVVTGVALLTPGGFLEPIWRLNPRAKEGFAQIAPWGPVMMAVVSAACGFAAVGLWRGRRWGRLLAIGGISMNLVGDTLNGILGTEPRALVGVPIAAAILVYLFSRRVREWAAE